MMSEAEALRRVEDLIRMNGADLLRYFLRRVPNSEDAADLLHNTFLVVWRRRAAVPVDALHARMWCFGVARNVLREGRRAGARRDALADALEDELRVIKKATIEADPEKAAERAELAAAVRSALDTLDTRSRELIILVHWDDFSLKEAAKQLRMNESTARTRYARARTKLANQLESQVSTQDDKQKEHTS